MNIVVFVSSSHVDAQVSGKARSEQGTAAGHGHREEAPREGLQEAAERGRDPRGAGRHERSLRRLRVQSAVR